MHNKHTITVRRIWEIWLPYTTMVSREKMLQTYTGTRHSSRSKGFAQVGCSHWSSTKLRKLCGQKRHTREKLAPVRSEKTHTRDIKLCTRESFKISAVSGQRRHLEILRSVRNYCGQKRHTGEASNIVRSETTRMQNDTCCQKSHTGESAGVCGQKRHTHMQGSNGSMV